MPSKSNVVCPQCQKEMMCERVGVIVEEHREGGQPYKIWSADLYKCYECQKEIITAFSDRPLAQHFEEEEYERLRSQVVFHIH